MDTNNGYRIIEQKLNELKNPVSLRGLGLSLNFTFWSFVALVAIAIVTLFGNLWFADKTSWIVDFAGGSILSLVLAIVGLFSIVFSIKHKEFKKRELIVYVLFLAIIILSSVFPWYKLLIKDVSLYPMCFSVSCVFSSLVVLLLLGIKYFDSPTVEANRQKMRIDRTNMIKYFFLGVVSGDDNSLVNYLNNNKIDPEFDFVKKNTGMINKILTDSAVQSRFEPFMEYCSKEIEDEIKDLKSKISFSYAATLFSAAISFCISSYNKIGDAVNEFISVHWKAEYTTEKLIDDMPKEKAAELATNLLQSTVLFQIFLVLLLAAGLGCFFAFRNFNNQRDTNRLNNYKISLRAIWDLQHAITSTKEKK